MTRFVYALKPEKGLLHSTGAAAVCLARVGELIEDSSLERVGRGLASSNRLLYGRSPNDNS